MLNGLGFNSAALNGSSGTPPPDVNGNVSLVEFATLDDIVVSSTYMTVTETAGLGDTTSGLVWTYENDRARITDIPAPRSLASGTLAASARLDDAVVAYRIVRLDENDTAVLNDAHAASAYAAVNDPATLNDTAHPRALAETDTVSRSRPSERVELVFVALVNEAATLNDAALATPTNFLVVADTALLNDATTPRAVARNAIDDAALLNDTALTQVDVTNDVLEQAFLFDAITANGAGPVLVWTANTWTWAMSTYSDLPLHDMASTLAVGPGGVYTQGGTAVPVRIKTGDLDFKEPMKKRIPWFYATGHHGRPLRVTVDAVVGDRRMSNTYTETQRFAGTDRTTRVQMGKGYNSNYYQFTIHGESPLTLTQCEAMIAPSSRRI
jgi:hypothetical protein